MKIKKIVLAYSGGLDTSVMIRYLKEKYRSKVIAFAADLGQGEDLKPLVPRAKKAGADKVIIKDLKKEFAYDFVLPAIKINAMYENKYPLATALGRPLITKHLIEIAKKEKADAVAHGCTGKGNDQVRFEVSALALNPDIKVLAPVRSWEFKSREEEIDYALKHKIPVDVTKKSPYSYDLNLWGLSIECGILEDPWASPPEDIYKLTVSPEKAPDKPEVVTLTFDRGKPVKLNGRKYDLVTLIQKLNKIAGRNGVGRIDIVENRLVGIKSREVYEAPAAVVLIEAHRALESLTLDRELMHFKEILSLKFSELVYYGLWFSHLRKAIVKFFDEVNTQVSGEVRLKLYKGSVIVCGRKSRKSLYEYKLATYEKGDLFDQKLSEGFIKLWGLPYQISGKHLKF